VSLIRRYFRSYGDVMSASTISAVILPLVGVALGTAGTLTGQYLAVGAERRRHKAELAAAARSEVKQAITEFLAVAQRAERVVDNAVDRSVATERDTVDSMLHELWLSKKLMELVCSHELSTAAHAYTSVLDRMARGTAGEPERQRQRVTRGDFMEAARQELGVSGPRLYPGSAPAPRPNARQEPASA
jgi:hypothetical protein